MTGMSRSLPHPRAAGGETPGKTRHFVSVYALAWQLLWCGGAVGCFNPAYIGDVLPRENHVPVIANIRPPPNFNPIVVPVVAEGCDDVTFGIEGQDGLQDVDGDHLTVRWDLLVNRGGLPRWVNLREDETIAPLDNGQYPITDATSIPMSLALLRSKLLDLDEQFTLPHQLLELRISDGGIFAEDNDNGKPIADARAGVAYVSWQVDLVDVCTGGI